MEKQEQDPELEKNFAHHPPTGNQFDRYKYLREQAKALAYAIKKATPASREQSLALTNLEQAIFWSNAAIARTEQGDQNG